MAVLVKVGFLEARRMRLRGLGWGRTRVEKTRVCQITHQDEFYPKHPGLTEMCFSKKIKNGFFFTSTISLTLLK